MSWRSLVDQGLELTVVGSFSRVGYAVRRLLYAWSTPAPGALDGKTVLVTGPTSGLGRAATDELAALGARVILVGRSEERLAAVRDALVSRHGADRFPTVVADMGSLRSIAEAVATIRAREPRLDVVVDNAGAIFPTRTVGPDGIEAMFATLVVGPFALVSGLLPILRQSEGARVIAVTSGGMYGQRLDLYDLQSHAEPYSGPAPTLEPSAHRWHWYANGRAGWGRRASPSTPMHPGWADTPGLRSPLPGFHRLLGPILRTPSEGVDTLVWLAAASEAAALSGGLFLDRRPPPSDRVPPDASARGRPPTSVGSRRGSVEGDRSPI